MRMVKLTPAVCVAMGPPAAASTRNLARGALVIVNALLCADVRLGPDAVRFFEPTSWMLRLLKVATPLVLVGWLVVPLSVPVPVVSVIVMETPAVAELLPKVSWSCTVMAGVIADPAAVSVGCCTKTIFVGVAALIVNELLVT